MKWACTLPLVLLALSPAVHAQIITTGTGLPGLYTGSVPPGGLRLPPNNVQVLPINHDTSYYSDAVRAVDCPNEVDLPFGICRNLLFGGHALMSTHLNGYVQIRFYPPVRNISHFEVTHPLNLIGDDTVMKAPQFYEMPVLQNFILDPFTNVSSGDLNLTTGEVTNLNYSVLVNNTWYSALTNANPKLVGSGFNFPGPYGYAQAIFTQRPDGLLDFTFIGGSFLPLGGSIGGDPTRLPLPFCGPLANCSSIQAQGTVLHPNLRISTVGENLPSCSPNCPALPANGDLNFTTHSYSTTLGDNFNLNVPELGGIGPARSQLTGRAKVQFGQPNGNFVPFVISGIPPEGLIGPGGPIPPGTVGFAFSMLGSGEKIFFPKLTYFFNQVGTGDDPFNLAVGELNLATGNAVGNTPDYLPPKPAPGACPVTVSNPGNMFFRSYFSQSIFQALARMNPGISPASEPFQGPLKFETGVNGQIVVRFAGQLAIGFSGFVYPAPNFQTGFITGPDSKLDLFYHIQGMRPVDTPTATKTGSASNVVSSIGDTVSYNYSIPCNGVGNGTFTYTNNNASGTATAGTFTLKTLSSVSCINSMTSTAAPGDYDTVQFAGFGTWNTDTNPHIVTVQISTSPNYPLFHVMVDGGSLSLANNRPPDCPAAPAVSPLIP